jgi:hypothetical protein
VDFLCTHLNREDEHILFLGSPVFPQGRTPEHKIFAARNIKTGFWAGSITVAVVRYRKGMGYLNTAYLATLEPNGRVLWQHP